MENIKIKMDFCILIMHNQILFDLYNLSFKISSIYTYDDIINTCINIL